MCHVVSNVTLRKFIYVCPFRRNKEAEDKKSLFRYEMKVSSIKLFLLQTEMMMRTTMKKKKDKKQYNDCWMVCER